MPRYHFATCGVAGQDFALLDPAGSILEDDAAATFYARRLARGIKKRTMVHPIGWNMVVRQGERDVCFLHIGPYDLRRKIPGDLLLRLRSISDERPPYRPRLELHSSMV